MQWARVTLSFITFGDRWTGHQDAPPLLGGANVKGSEAELR